MTVTDTGILVVQEEPQPSQGTHLRRPPASTSTLFALLALAVAATAGLVYTQIYLRAAWVTRGSSIMEVVERCAAAEPILASDSASFNSNELTWYRDALQRRALCVAPEWRAQVSWAAYGNMLLFGVAFLGYWVHPRVIIRRRGLRPLGADPASRQVHDHLQRLSERAGLARSPVFMAGAAEGVNGQAFGRHGRYYIRLDAGLLDLYHTDRDRFDAVVLHELGHVFHRDVDKTYLTVAIWWSFIVVALVPMLVFVVHPAILVFPLRWGGPMHGWVIFGGVPLALAVLVLFIRNAMLRARETYADLRVAACGGSLDALREVIRSQDRPLLRGVLARHPHPTGREKAVDYPDTVVARACWWETAVAGFTTGVIVTNLQHLVSTGFPEFPFLGSHLVGLICVPALVVPLGVAVWRATVAARLRASHTTDNSSTTNRPPWWQVVGPAMTLTVGFVLGDHVTTVRPFQAGITDPKYLAAAFLLLVGAVAVAGWMAMAMHITAVGGPGARRRAAPVLIGAATLAAAPWTALWITHMDDGLLVEGSLGARLSPDVSIGWFDTLVRWSQVTPVMLPNLVRHPLVLPGLTLLWLTPWLLSRRPGRDTTRRSHSPVRLRPAIVASALTAVALVLVCTTIGAILGVLLPVEVRDSTDFAVMYTYLDVAVLGVVCAVGVVSARFPRWSVVLVPFTLCLAGVLATLAVDSVALPIARCADLFNTADRSGLRCASPLPSDIWFEPTFFHMVIVESAVLALPVILIASAVARIRWVRQTRRAHLDQASYQPSGSPTSTSFSHQDVDLVFATRHPKHPSSTPPQPVQLHQQENTNHDRHIELARPRRHRRIPASAPTVAVAILATTTVALAILNTPQVYKNWLPVSLISKPNPPGPTAKLASVSSCLVGTWKEYTRTAYRTIDGTEVQLDSEGRIYTFRDDGTGSIDYGTGITETGMLRGQPVTVTIIGHTRFQYETNRNEISYTRSNGVGTITVTVNGILRTRTPLDDITGPGYHNCEATDTMGIYDSRTYTNEMQRLSRTPNHYAAP